MSLTLDDLRDRALISSALNRYAQGVDQRQWSLFLSAFARDARIEVPGYSDAQFTPQEFKEFLTSAFDSIRISGQHALSNTRFEIVGEYARTVTEFMAVNLERSGTPSEFRCQRAAGLYIDEWQRNASVWEIVRHVIVRKSDDQETVAIAPEHLAMIDAVRDKQYLFEGAS